MRLACYYFKLQMKKSIRVMPVFFLSIFVMTMLLVAGILIASYVAKNAGSFEKVNVAIVIPDENETSKQVMSFVEAMENVSAVCDFSYMTQKEADQEIKTGSMDVELLISPDFYNDVNTGVNSPVTVRMAENGRMEKKVFKELLADGVQLVQVTEASIYGTDYVLKQYDKDKLIPEMEDLLTEIYVANVLQRGDTFSQIVLSPAGQQKLSQYYAVSVLLVVTVMTGMCYGFLYRKEDVQIADLLYGRGLTPLVISVVKTLTMAIQVSVLVLVYCAGMSIYSEVTGDDLLYVNGGTVIQILIVAVCFAAYFHMMYSWFLESGKGGFVIFICNILMCVFSGILIPFSRMPGMIEVIRPYVPFTIWQQYITEVFLGESSLIMTAKMIFMTIVFEVIGVFGICKKV